MPKGVYIRKTNPIANFGGKLGRPSVPLEDRFWSKVNKNGPVPEGQPELGPCWIWTAATDKKGYGKIQTGTLAAPKYEQAHRVAWRLTNGREPVGNVLHHCDTPGCVRHLFEGTTADNAADMVAKGRQSRGERHPFAKLTNDQVREIRAIDLELASPGKIAKKYGVSYFTIRRVLLGEVYKDVK